MITLIIVNFIENLNSQSYAFDTFLDSRIQKIVSAALF